MKFIEWGTKDGRHALAVVAPETGRHLEERPCFERYLRIYMPWVRKLYSINVDDLIWRQPCLGIYWHRHPNFRHVHFLRWGWQ